MNKVFSIQNWNAAMPKIFKCKAIRNENLEEIYHIMIGEDFYASFKFKEQYPTGIEHHLGMI